VFVGSSASLAMLRYQQGRRLKYFFPFRELNVIFVKKTVRVIAKKILRDFWVVHEDSEEQLHSWYQEVSKATWKNLNELKKEYPSASILTDNRVVFNIKGNNYRLIVRINFYYQMIWIRFIGTHAEYDKINAHKI
jgi:mRNA interferase HigB